MYKYILFDLDGTLTDSAPGIIRCVQYALEKCGKGTCHDRELLPFIGPPLTESFQKVCGMTAAEARRYSRITAKPAAGRQDPCRSHQQAAALRRKNPGTLWPRRSLLNNSRPRVQRRAANQSRRDQRSAAAAAPYRC